MRFIFYVINNHLVINCLPYKIGLTVSEPFFRQISYIKFDKKDNIYFYDSINSYNHVFRIEFV